MTIYQSSSLKEDVDDISESESSSWAGAGPPSGAGASGFLENNAMKKKESFNSYCKPLSTIQKERETVLCKVLENLNWQEAHQLAIYTAQLRS